MQRLHRSDLSASITVFLIAVPLSLGIALATGAPLQAGLVAAAVGGIVAGSLGGAPLQVSGAATSLVVVTAELVQRYGWRSHLRHHRARRTRPARCSAVAAGGPSRPRGQPGHRARHARRHRHGHRRRPAPCGARRQPADLHAWPTSRALPGQLMVSHPATPFIGALTVAVLLGWPRLRGPGRAVLRTDPGATRRGRAGHRPPRAGRSLPRVDLPALERAGAALLPEGPVLGVAAAVLTVTLVASMESLLSAVAVDALQAKRPGPHAPPADARPGTARPGRRQRGLRAARRTARRRRRDARLGQCRGGRRHPARHDAARRVGAALRRARRSAALELIPLAALAALVMLVGVRMVSFAHIRQRPPAPRVPGVRGHARLGGALRRAAGRGRGHRGRRLSSRCAA